MSDTKSAKTTLKNTGLVGGSQLVSIVVNVVKTKFIAIFLGPGGVGLIQLFTTTLALLNSVFGLGLSFSGVRDVSESFGTGDMKKVARTKEILKSWAWATSIVGVIITLLLSKKISEWTFGSYQYWIEISLLSVIIILTNLMVVYSSIIRGARRMADFAKVTIISSIVGTIIACPTYYFLREDGIVIVLITTSILILIVNVIYSRKITIEKIKVSYREKFHGGLGMIKLGLFTVVTGFISQATMYYVRVSISDNLDIEAVGYYTVATTLTVTYMGLIFTAMAADYFPKLSAINKDNEALNEAVLEQTKIVLLLGVPLIIGMYTFSEYIIRILYTEKFVEAQPLLMWMLLSVLLRLVGFPTGYVFLAKGKGKIFIFTQSQWNIIFLLGTILFWYLEVGLIGIGIAFLFASVGAVIVNFVFLKRLTKLTYDLETIKYITLFSLLTVAYFATSYFFTGTLVMLIKFVGFLIISFYSLKKLEKLIGVNIVSFIRSKIKKK